MVGEYAGVAANPEVIVPLNKLENMIGKAIDGVTAQPIDINVDAPVLGTSGRGAPETIQIRGDIAGEAIRLSNARSERKRSLVE